MRMVRWLRWHCPPDTGLEIRALAVWGRARWPSPTILTFTRGWGRNIFVSFKPPRPGTEPRTLAWKAAVLTTTLGPPPILYVMWFCKDSYAYVCVLTVSDDILLFWQFFSLHGPCSSPYQTSFLRFFFPPSSLFSCSFPSVIFLCAKLWHNNCQAYSLKPSLWCVSIGVMGGWGMYAF